MTGRLRRLRISGSLRLIAAHMLLTCCPCSLDHCPVDVPLQNWVGQQRQDRPTAAGIYDASDAAAPPNPSSTTHTTPTTQPPACPLRPTCAGKTRPSPMPSVHSTQSNHSPPAPVAACPCASAICQQLPAVCSLGAGSWGSASPAYCVPRELVWNWCRCARHRAS